jgi:phosphoglycolate phosphatase-like HAD superfamily hydrolase
VAVAQGKAATAFGFDAARDVTVVIGDTTLDVEAGLYGAARVLAVATGVSSVDELQAAGADAVLPDLRDVERFAAELRRVIALGPAPRRAQDSPGA